MAAYDLDTKNSRQVSDAFATVVPISASFGAFNVGHGSAKGGSTSSSDGSASATAALGSGGIPQWVWIAGAVAAAFYLFKGGRRG